MKSPKANILFITGTDTGIGKTVSSCALVQNLHAQGVQVKVAKPVETGCLADANGELRAVDAARLLANASSGQDIAEVVPYRFRLPVSPNVASVSERREIAIDELQTSLRALAKSCDLLVVEGAGGVLVPLIDGYTFADFARDLDATAALVVGSRLGCLNHAQLSVEALMSRGIPLAGYVFNDLNREGSQATEQDESAALESNRETLKRLLLEYELNELAYLPFQSEIWASDQLRCRGEVAGELKSFSDAIIEHFALKR